MDNGVGIARTTLEKPNLITLAAVPHDGVKRPTDPNMQSTAVTRADYGPQRIPLWSDLFDDVRAIPQIVDGIRCHCGCADLDGHYSLLTCYEGEDAMAKICPICQGMGRVAVRMHKAGRSLDEIRVAVDAQFG